MTVYEYSIKVNKTVDEILMLCKKLGINVSSKDDILSTDDIILLDKNLQNTTSTSTTNSYSGGGSTTTVNSASTQNTYSKESVDSNATQNTNSEINIDPECLVKECNLIKKIAGKLSSFSESINLVNINGTESINNDLLKESKNIDAILDSQKKTLSSMVTDANELKDRIVNVKSTLEENNPELALLFAWLDEDNFDEFNESDDVVENSKEVDSEQQTTSLELDSENDDKSVESTKTADTPSNEFEENLNKSEKDENKTTNKQSANLKPKNNSDISHRGYGAGASGNNYATNFISAGEKGFWGCEADVRLYNGNLVCSHNEPDTPQGNKNPTSFEEYLDICNEYGMTAIIDLKYEGNDSTTPEPELAEAIIQTIEEKGMINNCILQTNSHTDISHIRETSEDARIWYLVDSPEVIDKYITPYNVEGVNICAYAAGNLGTTLQRIKTFVNNGIDVCVWGVTTESGKQKYLDAGASHVMSDYVLGITPYQEGEFDYNGIEN